MKSLLAIVETGTVLLTGLCSCFAQINPTFTKVTAGPLGTDTGWSGGFAWGDYDNDGWMDLFVPKAGIFPGLNAVYHNAGNREFAAVAAPAITTDSKISWGAAWADYDNDGHLDLYVCDVRGLDSPGENANALYRNLDGGMFQSMDYRPMTSDVQYANSACWGDYDNDGNVDLLVLATWYVNSGRPVLFHNNGDGTFNRVKDAHVSRIPVRGCGAGWCDYNNDGRLDLIVVARENKLVYENKGGGVFTNVSNSITAETSDSSGFAWGDYDNDGRPDLFLSAFGTVMDGGDNLLFHNEGKGKFARIVLGRADWSTAGSWADYDNDGYLDLLVTQYDHYRNLLYHNNGDGSFTQVLEGNLVNEGSYSFHCAWADYDNDGFMDLITGHTEQSGSTVSLFHNNVNSNHWLRCALVGTIANRSAVGAKIRVKATIRGRTFWQLREVSGGRMSSQDDPRPHFGLGDASKADIVRVEWPSGLVQEFTNVAANQAVKITEPPRLKLQGLSSDARLRLEFIGNSGCRYQLLSSTNLTEWEPDRTFTCMQRVTLMEQAARGDPQRYYRVRLCE